MKPVAAILFVVAVQTLFGGRYLAVCLKLPAARISKQPFRKAITAIELGKERFSPSPSRHRSTRINSTFGETDRGCSPNSSRRSEANRPDFRTILAVAATESAGFGHNYIRGAHGQVLCASDSSSRCAYSLQFGLQSGARKCSWQYSVVGVTRALSSHTLESFRAPKHSHFSEPYSAIFQVKRSPCQERHTSSIAPSRDSPGGERRGNSRVDVAEC